MVVTSDTKEADLAVVKIDNSLISKPSLNVQATVAPYSSVSIVGFQERGTRLVKRTLKGKLGSTIEIASRYHTSRYIAWDIQVTGDFTLQRGYSGSPVIEMDNLTVIGVMSDRQGKGKTGIAISIDVLPEIGMKSHRSWKMTF